MKKVKQFGCLAIAIATLSACNSSSESNEQGAKDSTVVNVFKVKVDTVKLQPVEQTYEFTATVEPEIKNNIAPTSPGRIMDIMTEVGQTVQKGQLLVKMDPTSLINQKAQLANIELQYNRTEELRKAGGASQQAVDQLKTQLDVAKASYQNLLDNANLRSPINGIVTARNFDSGDLYSNTATPILTIMQIRPVKILINVSESYFTNIKNGMKVDVTTDVFGDKKFPGKVSLIYPTIDEKTRTFPVEISIPNNNGAIRPGMFARVSMNFGTKNHIVVPDNAIVKRAGSGDRYIYVYNNDGTVSYDKVELGRRMGAEYELVSGIENGAVIVTSGQAKLNDGAKVEVIR